MPDGQRKGRDQGKKKKGLEGYFGTGARVPPPNREGTPIDAVGKRRGEEDRTNVCTAGEGGRTPDLTEQGHRDNSNKGEEGDKRGNRKKSTPNLEGTPIGEVDRRRGERTRRTIVQEGRERACSHPQHMGTKTTQTREGRATKGGIDENLHQTRKGLQLVLAEEE